jgi:hypothetical protein
MAKREPQIILKTDQRQLVLPLGTEAKFSAKSGAWEENRVFLEGDQLDIKIKDGRWVLTHVPAGPPSRPSNTSRPTSDTVTYHDDRPVTLSPIKMIGG